MSTVKKKMLKSSKLPYIICTSTWLLLSTLLCFLYSTIPYFTAKLLPPLPTTYPYPVYIIIKKLCPSSPATWPTVLTNTIIVLLSLSFLAYLYTLTFLFFSDLLKKNNSKRNNEQRLLHTITKNEIVLVASIFFIGLILRLQGITEGLGYDELLSASHYLLDSFHNTFTRNFFFNNHIANSVLGWIMQSFAGKQEWALRFPSLLFGCFSIIYLWGFFRRLIGPSKTLWCVLFLAVLPAHIQFSHAFRGYAGVFLFSLISTDLFLKILENPSKKLALRYIIFSTLATTFHLFGMLSIMAHYVFIHIAAYIQLKKNKPSTLIDYNSYRILYVAITTITALSILCYLPTLCSPHLYLKKATEGIFQPTLILETARSFLGNTPRPTATLLALIFFLSGIYYGMKNKPKESYFFLLLLAIIPTSLWLLHPPYFFPRFYLFLYPYFIFFIVIGAFNMITLFSSQKIKKISTAFCLIAGLFFAFSCAQESLMPNEEDAYREAVSYMNSFNPETTVFCANIGTPSKINYYFDHSYRAPTSLKEMENILNTNRQVICIYRNEDWIPEYKRNIATLLYKKATPTSFGDIIVFHYEKNLKVGNED